MTIQVYRKLQQLLILTTLFVLGGSFYFQYMLGLQPCPLCLMQRACLFGFAVFCLLGLRQSSIRRSRNLVFIQMFFACSGFYFAARQVWLQLMPAQHSTACMPGVDVLMRYFPWQDVVHALFWGAGDCAEVKWQWLGLSMPAWSALYFLFASFICLILALGLHLELKSKGSLQ